MLVYLSKKIAIPNNVNITCLSWSLRHDWIAIGGDDGLLKILKLDSEKDGKSKSGSASANLSLNQNLEGHTGSIQVIAWNEEHEKLTSSDNNGLVIVWMLHKGSWYEEMINNRNKSVVKDLTWNYDGQKICIIYEDGAVIVGSVDGNRIWGKELKKLPLSNVQWSPDSGFLLFGMRNGEVHLYDEKGTFLNKLQIQCLPSIQIAVQIAGMHWYDGKNGLFAPGCPQLIIAYQSGHIQLMKNQYDDRPLTLSTNIRISYCRWNHNGNIFAIVGSTVLTGENMDSNILQFYNPLGEHIQSLKLPGNKVSVCSWEGNSLRLAIAIDGFIYFANLHHSYQWCYFSDTLVFRNIQNAASNPETAIIFWNVKTNEYYQKSVPSLISLAAYKDHCVLGIFSDTQHALNVCSAISVTIDCKYMDLKPTWVAMNGTFVFAASNYNFLIWNYLTPKLRSALHYARSRYKKERMYHIDDTPSGVAEIIQDLDKNIEPTKDEICCIDASDEMLLIGRKSGTIQRYTLPQVALVQRITLKTIPRTIKINCTSSNVAVIDFTGILSIITIDKGNSNEDIDGKFGNKSGNEVVRRDVWHLKWASDNPLLLAIMEKTRMYVLRGNLPEEPISSIAYIAEFKDLEIKSISLDEIIRSPPAALNKNDLVINYEIKSLRDTRELLEKVGIKEATQFIENNSHPRLWLLLAEGALKNLDLKTAESAYVRCSNYGGIQLIKRLSNIQNDQLKKAQISAYLKNYDEAEKIYLKADRRDLAISLREKLGDWFRVIELMKLGSVTSDSLLTKAYNLIGDYFVDRNNLKSSKEYYQKTGNYEKLIMCNQALEDYKALESLISLLPEGHTFLKTIAEIFFSVGMSTEAANAYIKFGSYQLAVDVYIKSNKWDLALEIANKYSVETRVNDLFQKYVSELVGKGNLFDAVQLYKQANKYLQAAELLYQIADEEKERGTKSITLKKLHVLIALLVEDHIKQNRTTRLKSAGVRSRAVFGFEIDSVKNMKLMDDPWHNAKAYHFLMLSQRLFANGNIEAAFLAAIELKRYEDVLSKEQIYCIISVTAIACKNFETASKAFMELESLDTASTENYENIAFGVFSKYPPKDSLDKYVHCPTCSSNFSLWDNNCSNCERSRVICVTSGRIIENDADSWQCPTCNHFSYRSEIRLRKSCSLCHSLINNVTDDGLKKFQAAIDKATVEHIKRSTLRKLKAVAELKNVPFFPNEILDYQVKKFDEECASASSGDEK